MNRQVLVVQITPLGRIHKTQWEFVGLDERKIGLRSTDGHATIEIEKGSQPLNCRFEGPRTVAFSEFYMKRNYRDEDVRTTKEQRAYYHELDEGDIILLVEIKS